MQEPIEGPTGGRGKWSKAGVPKRGWVCEGEEDLGTPSATCEMCETVEIRFVHYMVHEDYPEVLACGCVCAGHMEEDAAAAQQREKNMKGRARRRTAWPDRAGWRLSKAGNWTIKKDGFQMTVFERGGQYRVSVSTPLAGKTIFGRRNYDTLRRAQLATFDAFVWAKDN